MEQQQALLQTVSDPLLGWTTVDGLQYYVRQFRNMKGTIPLDAIDAAALTDYAGIVGHLLAKGHARTSGASMIAGYAGAGDKLDQALAKFARAYADQTEADHAELVKAVRRGALPVIEGTLEQTGSAFARDGASPRAAGSPEHAEADHGEGTNEKASDSCDGEPARQDAIGIGGPSSRSDAPSSGGLGRGARRCDAGLADCRCTTS